jgi:geranylgeranyl diphosphate synthase type I
VLRETLRVIGGQELELAMLRAEAPTLDQYEAMVEGKTSGLFALPMAGAAELCGAAPELARGLQQAAGHLGVLFQIQDDVLDLFADKGRDQRGSDIREGKRSILVVHALQQLPPDDAARLREILDLDREQTGSEEVQQALELLAQAGSLSFALEQIAHRRDRALAVSELKRAPGLRQLVVAICELFLQPIQPVLERYGRPAAWSQAG